MSSMFRLNTQGKWCGQPDLNWYEFPHRFLRPECLPIPPCPHIKFIGKLNLLTLRHLSCQGTIFNLFSFSPYCSKGLPFENIPSYVFSHKFVSFIHFLTRKISSYLGKFTSFLHHERRWYNVFKQCRLKRMFYYYSKPRRGLAYLERQR